MTRKVSEDTDWPRIKKAILWVNQMFRFPVKIQQITIQVRWRQWAAKTTALCFPKQYLWTIDKQTVKEVAHLDNTVAKLILVGKNHTSSFNLGVILIRERIIFWAFLMFPQTCTIVLWTARPKILVSTTLKEGSRRVQRLYLVNCSMDQ
jgi:hypothetical protein